MIAHRGGAALAPENTLSAFLNAARLGADGIELDVRATSDGFATVFHDATLDRLTDSTGRLRDWRFAGLSRSVRVQGAERIPLLEEVCAAMRTTGLRMFVEVKDADITDDVLQTLRCTGWEGKAVVGSFDPDSVGLVMRQGIFPALRLYRSEEVELLLAQRTLCQDSSRNLPYHIVGLAVADTTPERVAALHECGVAVWVWTANSEDQIRSVLRSGADAVISDHPDLCLQIRNSCNP